MCDLSDQGRIKVDGAEMRTGTVYRRTALRCIQSEDDIVQMVEMRVTCLSTAVRWLTAYETISFKA